MSARRITPRDFLDLLPIVAGEGWHVIQSYVGISYIRNARGECPLCAFWREVGGAHHLKHEPHSAAARLGFILDESTITAMDSVVDAADFQVHPYRARLMQALDVHS